jgi:hypothetical protein
MVAAFVYLSSNNIFLLSVGENTVSTLGRLVLIIWLFVVLIINSSYTASLTSILTVQQLSSPIKGIETLINSNDPIGYQQGSYARNYLVEELGIRESRLFPYNSPEDFTKALKDGPHRGGVAAIVDERAYVDLFLSTRCEFSIVGQQFTKAGWGFVSLYFPALLVFRIHVRLLWTYHNMKNASCTYNLCTDVTMRCSIAESVPKKNWG